MSKMVYYPLINQWGYVMKLASKADTLAEYEAPFTLFEVVRGGFGIIDSNRKFLHMADQDPIMANIQVEAYNLFWEQNKIPPIYVPDWTKAPDDAKYHTIDADGQCTWWVNEPMSDGDEYWFGTGGHYYGNGIITPHSKWSAGWWMDTLSQKPD